MGSSRQFIILLLAITVLCVSTVIAGDKVYPVHTSRVDNGQEENIVRHRCLTPDRAGIIDLGLQRAHPWSLPTQALAPDFDTTIHVLVLRFNFQYEEPDDPNTTGRGYINLSNPLAAPEDSAAYYDSVGHWIDPPPHDSVYFDALMRALNRYWEVASEQKITLTWDIYPPAKDSMYQLPQLMNYYGKCEPESVVVGLERYFIDCIQLVDTVSPEIHFADYQSIFLFHAGADRQNDLGFPETCNDLFTGFISFGDSVAVDSGTHYVRTALMMPETASQDNRATALNAVMAHEFGHQLGLVDLYSTRTFLSQLGDFALMDNNGFGTGIDFGFNVGRVFGALPLFPSAWSRAFLGVVPVHDFRWGTDIRIAAAEMVSNDIKIARILITENEYYLLENRIIDVDGIETGVRADSVTSVIQGPVQIFRDGNGNPVPGDYTTEYDILMPGSGMLIYHVDESVFGMDYDGDGQLNFDDNDLQWDPDRKFISLVEGDGIINFGGYYRAGWGTPDDMYRDDRNTSFTPNTNPPTIDNTGNNTHIYLTGISRVADTSQFQITYDDRWMRFDVRTDRLVPGFPVRVGAPSIPLAPIADDINRDGTSEIIAVSGNLLSVMTTTGDNFLRKVDTTITAPFYYDTALASIHSGKPYPVPLYAKTAADITAGPVTGDFGNTAIDKRIAVGISTGASSGLVIVYEPIDDNNDGEADFAASFFTSGVPIALIFGESLYFLTDNGNIYLRSDEGPGSAVLLGTFPNEEYHGICKSGEKLILVAGDSSVTTWYAITPDYVDSISVNGYYRYGPIAVDVDLDGRQEIVGISPEGKCVLVTVDTSNVKPVFSILRERETSIAPVETNPVAADIDSDGYPDIITGGDNMIYALNRILIPLSDFPFRVTDRSFNNRVIAAPVVADIEHGGKPEIIFPTQAGNIYSFGSGLSGGFPLSAGEISAGAPVVTRDSSGGVLGYIGADGWFYLWEVDADTTLNYWPMTGGSPEGALSFDISRLANPKTFSDYLPGDKFYNYPNPVVNGFTRIRYFLGHDALSVALTVYDLSGTEITSFNGPTAGGVDNEIEWQCGDVTPGVYRCRIEADFGDRQEVDFTDIAIIR